MSAPLDEYVIIRAYHHATEIQLGEAYLLFRTASYIHDGKTHWIWRSIKDPKDIVKDSQWSTTNHPITEYSYSHFRAKTDISPESYYENTMARLNRYITILDLAGQRRDVYEWSFTKPNQILPPAYYYTAAGRDVNMTWHFKVLPLPLPQVPKAIQKAHSHVIRGFMECAILKKESCPITMDPFTTENIACTPCGHLFSREGISEYIRLAASPTCPTCRGKISQEEIVAL